MLETHTGQLKNLSLTWNATWFQTNRFAIVTALLFSLALVPGHPAMADDDRCSQEAVPAVTIRPFTDCEWQQISPRPGDEHVCDPVTLTGTDGPDRLSGNGGDDVIRGGKGKDTIRGDGGNDQLHGQNGPDVLYGGPDDDQLHGGKGKDRLYGGYGNDVLRGKQGNDVLEGGPGNDTLHGGDGDDTYTGDSGYDRFVFKSSQRGDKIITDFDPCFPRDYIVLSGRGFSAVADILASEVEEAGGYFVYTLRSGLTVETDVQLETGDFVLE